MSNEEIIDLQLSLGSFMSHCLDLNRQFQRRIESGCRPAEESHLLDTIQLYESLYEKSSDLWNELQPVFDKFINAEKINSDD